MVKNKLKRTLPLLLALVVLISCLPVIPAAAVSTITGTWRFNSSISFGEDVEFSESFDPCFTSYGDVFYDIEVYDGYIYYDSTVVYDKSGWANTDYRIIDFGSSGVAVSDVFYSWFISNASVYNPLPENPLVTSITIGSRTSVFSGSASASAEVDIQVTSTGCVMTSHSGTSSTWTYSGSDTFLGFAFTADATEPLYTVGSSFLVQCDSRDVSITLYPIVQAADPDPEPDPEPDPDPDPEVIFNTEITIGSMTAVCSGTTSASPDVLVTVTKTGVTLSYGTVTRSFDLASSDALYTGLSVSSDASTPDFLIGQSFTCPGSAGSNISYTFYPVYDGGFLNVIFVDGNPIPFVGSAAASPDITMTVTDTGAIFSDGSTIKNWLYSGSAGVAISSLAASLGWENEGYYPRFDINSDISVLAAGGAYSGKYYTYDNTWCIYQADNGVFQIDAGDYFIRSVVINYSYANSGTLMYNDVSYSSGSVIDVSDHRAIFKVGNLYDGTNGQVKIKSIDVVYSRSLQDDKFLGFSSTADGAVIFSPGNTYTLPGAAGSDASWELFSQADDGILNYTTIVHMPDALFTFSSTVSMPVVTVRVTEYGVVLTDGTKMEYWYPNGVLEFLGLAVTKGASEPSFPPGESFTVFGKSVVINGEQILEVSYFPVYGEKSNLLPGRDFAGWLVTAIGGFLAFELVPGFSLQDILSFVLLFGILLWVLKIAFR